uniref:DUF7027 domain-containing protein n=1 Tax=Onchocerca volvulus TaxID=6282 RepID=A0A8R1TM81_ONCVO
MQFDPDHPTWRFCFCHLRNCLMILAGSEIIISLLILLCSTIYIVIKNFKQENFLYPTIAARTIFIIFSYAISFSIAVQSIRFIDDVHREILEERNMQINLDKNKIEIYIIGRLLLVFFITFLITVFVLYTIYLIILCICYVKKIKRLRRKRSRNISLQTGLNRAATCIPVSSTIKRDDKGSSDNYSSSYSKAATC